MKKQKLVLSKETIQPLDAHALGAVVGGSGNYFLTVHCNPPTTTRIGPASMPGLCGLTGGCGWNPAAGGDGGGG